MTTATTPATGKQIVAPLQALIGGRILVLREQRVMLDADLAELYGVQTKVLVQAVKRNLARFPQDFMFQLSNDEFAVLRSQTVTSNTGRGGRRTAPYAFTEQGVAMLSSVLGSPRAIGVNIEITGVNEVGYWTNRHTPDPVPVVRIDPRYFRPTEVETLLGDPSKAKQKLGWVPEITAQAMCAEMVAHDLAEAKKHALLRHHGYSVNVSVE
ncbi:MAG: ORF6N domain-containing protein [Rhodoferax sp.]